MRRKKGRKHFARENSPDIFEKLFFLCVKVLATHLQSAEIVLEVCIDHVLGH